MSPDLRKFGSKKSSDLLKVEASEPGNMQNQRTEHQASFASCFSSMKKNLELGSIYNQRNVLPWTGVTEDGGKAKENAAAALLSLNHCGTDTETLNKTTGKGSEKINEFLHIAQERVHCRQPCMDVEDEIDIMDDEPDVLSDDEKETSQETKKRLTSTESVEDGDDDEKPNQSYISLIANAILASREKRLVLSDIYNYVLEKFPYFRNKGPGWRNSIRHNLSLNECFIKAGRSPNGKGHFWAINPANFEDFSKGDFRRRRAQRRARRSVVLQQYGTGPCGVINSPFWYHPYLNRPRQSYFDDFRDSHLPVGLSSMLSPNFQSNFHFPSNVNDILRKTRNSPELSRTGLLKKQKTGYDVESLLRKEESHEHHNLCSNHGTTSKIFTPVACHPLGPVNLCGCSHGNDFNLPNRRPTSLTSPCSCCSGALDKPFPLQGSRIDSSCPNSKLTFPFMSALLRSSINEPRYWRGHLACSQNGGIYKKDVRLRWIWLSKVFPVRRKLKWNSELWYLVWFFSQA